MMATKLEKCANALNERFRELIDTVFKQRFNIELETSFNLFTFALVSVRTDGEPLTIEQRQFVAGYSEGYAAAMNFVRQSDDARFFANEAR